MLFYTFYEFVLCNILHFTKICYNLYMNKDIDLKRKIYNVLLDWNNDPNKVPLIVDGLRQVGKSYIVDKFARENYANVITYDFRHNKELRKIFDGNLDVDTIIRNSTPYFPDKDFIPYETILIFEEISDCPLARTSFKAFAMDKRFTVIATGSLLGILNYGRKTKIDVPTGYEKIIHMSSLDFEEFLWANGVSEEAIDTLKEFTYNKKQLPNALADYYKEIIKRYVVIGGMPDSVKEFLKTNNYIKSRQYLENLIADYRDDFGRFINDDNEEEIDYRLQARLNQIFDSIPAQLARQTDTNKFKYSEVKKGGRFKEFETVFEWLEKAGLIIRCFNVGAIETPLQANADRSYFKAFFADIGLLMAMYPLSTSQEFLTDQLDSRKGAIFENLTAVMINKASLPLYYFSKGSEHLEIDFIVESDKGIVLIEEKSTNGKMAASKAVMQGKTKYKALTCYKIIRENFGQGDFYISVPQCAVEFILDDMVFSLNKGIDLKPLKYPQI